MDTLTTVAQVGPTGAQFASLCITIGLMAFFVTQMVIGKNQ